jgi:L-asparaginase/Glu-tRNA(Gln) amidotransferase subunit D
MSKKTEESQAAQPEYTGPSKLLLAAARRAADGLARTGRYRQSEIMEALNAINAEDVSPDVRRGLIMLARAHGLQIAGDAHA